MTGVMTKENISQHADDVTLLGEDALTALTVVLGHTQLLKRRIRNGDVRDLDTMLERLEDIERASHSLRISLANNVHDPVQHVRIMRLDD